MWRYFQSAAPLTLALLLTSACNTRTPQPAAPHPASPTYALDLDIADAALTLQHYEGETEAKALAQALTTVVYIEIERKKGISWPLHAPKPKIGSGVLVTDEGHIVTNHHVIEGALQIKITLSDKRCYTARYIGQDLHTDLAVLKINADSPLPCMPWGDSAQLCAGSEVWAIGHPYGLRFSVTKGIVSDPLRYFRFSRAAPESVHTLIQTDAATHPGNSGGPLVVVQHGQAMLVGINKGSLTDRAQRISFAIPASIEAVVKLLLFLPYLSRGDFF